MKMIPVEKANLPEEWQEKYPYGIWVEEVDVEQGTIETLAWEYSDGNTIHCREANDGDWIRTALEVSGQI